MKFSIKDFLKEKMEYVKSSARENDLKTISKFTREFVTMKGTGGRGQLKAIECYDQFLKKVELECPHLRKEIEYMVTINGLLAFSDEGNDLYQLYKDIKESYEGE